MEWAALMATTTWVLEVLILALGAAALVATLVMLVLALSVLTTLRGYVSLLALPPEPGTTGGSPDVAAPHPEAEGQLGAMAAWLKAWRGQMEPPPPTGEEAETDARISPGLLADRGDTGEDWYNLPPTREPAARSKARADLDDDG